MVQAYLLSLLSRQRLLMKDQFEARYGKTTAWLLWEPGIWSAPTRDLVAETRLPSRALPERPPKGDALCYALTHRHVRIGRSPDNDVCLNDATVSREHIILAPRAGEWALSAITGAQAVSVDRVEVPPDVERALKNGARIRIGDVWLTFYDAQGFLARVDGETQVLVSAAGAKPRSESTRG